MPGLCGRPGRAPTVVNRDGQGDGGQRCPSGHGEGLTSAVGRGETRGILSSSCWLRVGCPGQRWIRKAIWRCWWPRQGGGGRNGEERGWDSGRSEVEPTGFSDAGDVEHGKNRSIPDDTEPWPEDSAAFRRDAGNVCFLTRVATPSEDKISV